MINLAKIAKIKKLVRNFKRTKREKFKKPEGLPNPKILLKTRVILLLRVESTWPCELLTPFMYPQITNPFLPQQNGTAGMFGPYIPLPVS